MDWVHDVKGEAYEQLLTSLLSRCETVQCVMREEDDDYFEAIQHSLIDKKYVTDWPLTKLGGNSAPILQYTFHYNFKTATFLKGQRSSLFSWLMPFPEDWSFWQGDTCLLATCTHEQYVDIHPDIASEITSFFKRR